MLNDDVITYICTFCTWKDVHHWCLTTHRLANMAHRCRYSLSHAWLVTACDEEQQAILQHQPIPRTCLVRHVWWSPMLRRLNHEIRMTDADKCHFFQMFAAWKRYGIVPHQLQWVRHVLDDLLYTRPHVSKRQYPCLLALLRLPHSSVQWTTFRFDGFVLKDDKRRIYGRLQSDGHFVASRLVTTDVYTCLSVIERDPLRTLTLCPFCGWLDQHVSTDCLYQLADLGSMMIDLRHHGCRTWQRQVWRINNAPRSMKINDR